MGYLGGHTSNPINEAILNSNTNSKKISKRRNTKNHLLDHSKKLWWL